MLLCKKNVLVTGGTLISKSKFVEIHNNITQNVVHMMLPQPPYNPLLCIHMRILLWAQKQETPNLNTKKVYGLKSCQ